MFFWEGYINKEFYFIVCDEKSLIYVGNNKNKLDIFLKKNNISNLQKNYNIVKLYINQIEEYFRKDRKKFVFEEKFYGTEFQKSVWSCLKNIEYGDVVSYKKVAQMLGRDTSVRAVATAIAKNPLLIFIPCHRVVASDGSLRGYSGGLELKERLLTLEKENKKENL